MKTKSAATKTTETKLAYSYRRFSSRQQSDGSSLQRQLEMAQEVCAAQGWQLVDLPPDAGVSAYKVKAGDGLFAANMHKGNLGNFLERAERGEIKRGSILIIEKLDRFSRNYYDLVFPVWLNLLQSGIEIYSCVSRTHYTLETIRRNPMMAGMALIEMANANEYSSGMASRVSKAFAIRIAEASKGKKMCLGSWTPRWIDFTGSKKGEEGKFSLNAKAETVRRVVNEYIGGMSMSLIARGLARDNVPNLKHGKWSQGTVHQILQSECIVGHATVKGVRLERYYPPAITDEVYQQLRAKLADNVNRKGGNPKSDKILSLFRNRVKCAKCGGNVTSAGNQLYGYYHCRRAMMDDCGVHGCVGIRSLERDFFLLFLQEHPEALLGRQTLKSNGVAASLKARQRVLDVQIGEATNLLGKLPIAQLEAKLTALVKARDGVGRELEAANLKMMTTATVPLAFESIRKALAGFVKLGTDYAGSKAETRMVKAITQLDQQLDDNEKRKTLLALLPRLVSHLVLDVEAKRYRVANHAGELSDWRQLPKKAGSA